MVNYIVDRAVKNINDAQTYRWLLRMSADDPVLDRSDIQELRAPEEEVPPPPQLAVPKSSTLYPAIAYIASHPGQAVSMAEMADLCHLSPSYFSRLFHREMGEGFTVYVNRQKVELAKVQLRDSNKSISQISAELGYLNISHFINLFKRFEGITPLMYRQHKYR